METKSHTSMQNEPDGKLNNQDSELKFIDINNRFLGTDKRIDDIKWFLGGVTTFFGIVFSVLALIFNSNFNAEKQGLRDFKSDLKAELGKTIQPPLIELLTPEGGPLNGSNIEAMFEKDSLGYIKTTLHLILKNTGSSSSMKLNIKCYTDDRIQLNNKSTDESKYQYESYINSEYLQPNELPAHYSSEYFLWISCKKIPPPGMYPILLKIFYGIDKVAQAEFNIVLK